MSLSESDSFVLHAKQCRQEYLEGVRKDDAVQLPTVLKILQLMQPNLEALACRFVNMFADQCGTKSFCFDKASHSNFPHAFWAFLFVEGMLECTIVYTAADVLTHHQAC